MNMTDQVSLMKQTKIYTAIPLLGLVVLLASCGGGGDDEAGSPNAFAVVPSTLTVTAASAATGGPAAGRCAITYAGEFFVYGGSAPYRLDNTAPDAMILSKTSVDERGGSFSVSFINGICISPASVVVVDKLNNRVVLTLNNRPAA